MIRYERLSGLRFVLLIIVIPMTIMVSRAVLLEPLNPADDVSPEQIIEAEHEIVLRSNQEPKEDYAATDTEVSIALMKIEESQKKLEEKETSKNSKPSSSKQQKKYIGEFKLTGYCSCSSCSGGWGSQTAAGVPARAGTTVAADRNVLPLGTRIYIEGVGERIVQDVGGAIKGNKIDVYVNSHSDCYADNINTTAKVYILD